MAACALVDSGRTKVADDVDDAEDEAADGEEGEVGAVLVALHRVLARQGVQVVPHLRARHSAGCYNVCGTVLGWFFDDTTRTWNPV